MKLIVLISLMFLGLNASSQTVKGTICDISKNPLEEAIVYIEENKQGIVVNNDGQFEIGLDSGTYNLTVIVPEYNEQKIYIAIGKNDTLVTNITLEKQELYLDEYLRNYEIKKTIKKKLDTILPADSNNSFAYIRGEMMITEVSPFIDRFREKVEKQKLSDLKNLIIGQDLYVQINNMNSDSCNVEILNQEGKIPHEWSKFGILEFLSSLYQEKYGGKLSPLNIHTFSYYNFIYKGSYYNGQQTIHKVETRSPIKDANLLQAYLYFTDSWDLYSANVLLENKGALQNISIIYYPIEKGYYSPIGIATNSKVNIAGTKVDLQYKSYLSYKDLLPLGSSIDTDTAKNTNDKYVCDWNKLRTYPHINDANDLINVQKEKYDPSNYWLGRLLFGGYVLGNENSKWSMRYGGVKMVFRDYNYVDGFWLGQSFMVKGRLNNKQTLEINPYIYYLTARERLIGGIDLSLPYDKTRNGILDFSIGSKSVDFNSLSITRYQNYFSSLVFGENCNFFYQKDYISVSNNININPKLKLSTSVGVEKRHGLSNHTDFTLMGGKNIKPNIYSNDRFDQTYYSIGLSYSPNKKYNTSDALEVYEQQITPIFNLRYKEGFSSWQTNNSKYRKLEGGVLYDMQIDHFNEIGLKFEGGVFLDNHDKIHFVDFQHFGASNMLLNLNSFFDSFLLLDNYELQTNKYWFNAFFNYSGKYFLLKRIPFLQKKDFSENIHIKTLFTPDVDLYGELGYSITYKRYIGVGAFVSFNNTQVEKIGVRLSLNLRSLGLNL